MSLRTPRIASALLLVGTVVATALVYPSLPAEMATHWGPSGAPDDTMSKLYGAFLTPALMLFLTGVLYLVPRIDPRRANFAGFRAAYEWFVVVFLAFLAYVHGFVVLWNLGVHVPVGRALAVPFAALFYGLGLLMDRVEPNWFAGIRTPWTLSDDEVWRETHDRAAFLLKLSGIFALGGLAVPEYFLVFVLVPVVASLLYTVVYSYVAYQRRHEGS